MTKRTKLVELLLYLAGGIILIAAYAMATTPVWHQRTIAAVALLWVPVGFLMTSNWRKRGGARP
jgi:positive regulator of sigma E activity